MGVAVEEELEKKKSYEIVGVKISTIGYTNDEKNNNNNLLYINI